MAYSAFNVPRSVRPLTRPTGTSMTDTRSQLLESATSLFLTQGFAKTTIQQLADAAGISKGAFYLHFRSKNQLLLAIMEDIGRQILNGVQQIRDRGDLKPKEKLWHQLRFQFDDVLENQRMMEFYIKDSGIALDQEVLLLGQKMRLEWQHVQEEFLRMVFPDHPARYTADLAVMVNGALNEFYTFILLDEATLDADQVADFLLAMVEAMAQRLMQDDLEPVLDTSELPGQEDLEAKLEEASRLRVEKALEEIQQAANDLSEVERAEVGEILELLRAELETPEPKRMMLQGLLANLREHKTMQSARRLLASEWNLKLV